MKTIKSIIETPKHSEVKYSFDKHTGFFKLKKLLPAGMSFPHDFGFIPGTKGEDGDPLDSLVISEFKTFPGCMVECRLIGAMLAEEIAKGKKRRNDRFFLIPDVSKQFEKVESVTDLPEQFMTELLNFFVMYKDVDEQKFKMLEMVKEKEAMKIIKRFEK